MSLAQTVLKAVKKLGLATYTTLENETKENRNKLRWSCYELKGRQLIKQVEDTSTKEVAWKLTPKGELHLEGRLDSAEPEPRKATATTKQPAKAKPAKAKPEHVGRACTTPAEGGVNIIRSPASADPVGEAATSTEVRAVVETQAAGHAAETAGEATTATVEPAASDVTKNSPYVVEIIPTTRYTIKTTDGLIEDLEKASVWNGFTELRNQLGQKLIIAEHSPNAVSEYLSSVLTPNKKKEADKAVVISGTPALISKLFQQREAA